MPVVLADFVRETTTSPGTGSLTLNGATAGCQGFTTGVGQDNTTYYARYTEAQWEVGYATVSRPSGSSGSTVLSRTVLANSAGSTLPLDFGSTESIVMGVLPAERQVFVDPAGTSLIGMPAGAITASMLASTLDLRGKTIANSNLSGTFVWDGSGVAAPTVASRSSGTKIVLFPNVSTTLVDYAIGVEANASWQSVPDSSRFFKWYAGPTNIMTLAGTVTLSVNGSSVWTAATLSNVTQLANDAGYVTNLSSPTFSMIILKTGFVIGSSSYTFCDTDMAQLLTLNRTNGVKVLFGGLTIGSGGLTIGGSVLNVATTTGFLWPPVCAGTPTGAPAVPYSGAAALIVDTAANRLWVRIGSNWKYAQLN